MLIAYKGTYPVFFHPATIKRIVKISPVRREGFPEIPVPAAEVVTEDSKYTYLLDNAEARAAFRDVLFQSMELETAKKHFPEAWID